MLVLRVQKFLSVTYMLFSARLCRVPLFTIVTLLRQHLVQLGNYNFLFTALVESEQKDLHDCILNLFSPEGALQVACVASVPAGQKGFETVFRKLAARKLGQETEGTLARRHPIFEKCPPFKG